MLVLMLGNDFEIKGLVDGSIGNWDFNWDFVVRCVNVVCKFL